MFFPEAAVEPELFDLEGVPRQMRSRVEVMSPQAESSTEGGSIEPGRGTIDEQVASPARFHDAPEISGVCRLDRNPGTLTQEPMRTHRVFVSAPYVMPLARQQLCEQRAGRPCPQDKDSHR